MKIELIKIPQNQIDTCATIKQVDYIEALLERNGYGDMVKHITDSNGIPNITLATANKLIKGLLDGTPIKFVGINQRLRSISKTESLTMKANKLNLKL